MKIVFPAILSLIFLCNFAHAADDLSPVKLADLQAEHQTNPIGIGFARPRLSWKLISNRAGEMQSAYEIRAGSSEANLTADKPDVWDSGKIVSDQSVLVNWGGKPLQSRQRIFWQVRVWDKSDKPSPWSETASVEMGWLDASQWKGDWITVDLPRFDIEQKPLDKAAWINAGSASNQPAAVRTSIDLPGAEIRSATVDIVADGLITLYVNGTAYRQGASSHTAPFHAEFSGALRPGRNVIAIGANAVRLSRGGGRNAIAAQGVINLVQGKQIAFNTDSDWKAAIVPAGDTTWSAAAFDDSAWAKATVIGLYAANPAVGNSDGAIGPGRYLRKNFTAKGPIARAELYSTALGVYEASINGKPINDHQLDPGWTDYTKRVMVQTTDVTRLISPGNNTLGVILSDGWFAGRLGWMGAAQYAAISRVPLFNAQLEITYADGSTDVIATDNSWKGGPGEIVGSDQQLGEVLDARAHSNWDQPAYDDSKWQAVQSAKSRGPTSLLPSPGITAAPDLLAKIELDPQVGPPVRKLMEIVPKKITRAGDVYLVDFGQNFVGHIRLRASGPVGTTITVSHGEMLNADGTLYTENLRPAISLDTFILRGDRSAETFEPHFTFHGFRYAQITGYPGDLSADDIRGIVIGSDTPDTGTFSCSNADVNQLFSNIRWGQRGNFISVPTDCPQRDERMGWMGDAQVFAPTAADNADVSSFFTKWMIDVNDGQSARGDFSDVSPRVSRPAAAMPVWGDAGVLIPWDMYAAYGDEQYLSTNYDHMARWVDYCQTTFPNLLSAGGVGDHLAPEGGRGEAASAPTTRGANAAAARGNATGGTGRAAIGRGRGGAGGAITTTNVVDTAYFARSAWIVSKAAGLLGKTDDAQKYDALYHNIAAAFDKAYLQPDGTITAGTQTTYVLALEFGLLPENLRPAAAKHLADDVQTRGHLTTGFVGVGLINPGLTDIGRSDLAYQLLLVDTYPSWLFTIRQGATTMWERWDGFTPERGFEDSSMNSFNHYSLGSVGRWLYSGVGGINIDEDHPGFKHILLQPAFSTKINHVKVSFESPYGLIESAWELAGDQFEYEVTIPPNSTATLTLPAAQNDIRASGDPATTIPGAQPGLAQYDLAPGTYHFSLPKGSIN
jgi:alpha-L-rhamnosidase